MQRVPGMRAASPAVSPVPSPSSLLLHCRALRYSPSCAVRASLLVDQHSLADTTGGVRAPGWRDRKDVEGRWTSEDRAGGGGGHAGEDFQHCRRRSGGCRLLEPLPGAGVYSSWKPCPGYISSIFGALEDRRKYCGASNTGYVATIAFGVTAFGCKKRNACNSAWSKRSLRPGVITTVYRYDTINSFLTLATSMRYCSCVCPPPLSQIILGRRRGLRASLRLCKPPDQTCRRPSAFSYRR